MILHCMKKSEWEECELNEYWGSEQINVYGFVHCSTVEYFWRIASNFSDVDEELVLVCIDENRLSSTVKYEDGDNCGRYYPHIYGLVNNSAVIAVLPFLRDEKGNYIKNPEFAHISNK